jgi:hypothetical protein
MLLWALLGSGQIRIRKVDGWKTLDHPLDPATPDAAAGFRIRQAPCFDPPLQIALRRQ